MEGSERTLRVDTHNILTSLFRNSKKKPIWTPKTTSEAAKAVTKAIRLMPVACWAEPGLSGATLVVADAGAGGVVLLMVAMNVDALYFCKTTPQMATRMVPRAREPCALPHSVGDVNWLAPDSFNSFVFPLLA